MCIHSNRQTRVPKNTPIRCSCNLSRSCSDPDVPSAWQLSCSSHSQPFLASRWYVCTYICVCEHKFASVLWLMQDQSLTDPITRVCHARVASVWVMGKISSEMLLVSSILDHCGMLLSGKSLCDITHAYTQTHVCLSAHKNMHIYSQTETDLSWYFCICSPVTKSSLFMCWENHLLVLWSRLRLIDCHRSLTSLLYMNR